MGDLVIRIYAVGNADCIVLEMPNQELSVNDFCRRSSLTDHPLCPLNSCRAPKVVFVCLTHPHSDHMTGMESILDFVAASGGEFWHTVADMGEVLRLWAHPSVAKASQRLLTRELAQLASVASVVAKEFPADRIRFISAEPGAPVPILSTARVEVEVLGPSRKDAVGYVRMLHRVDEGKLQKVNDRMINRTSAVVRVRYGENTIILGGDAPSETWQQLTGRTGSNSSLPMETQAVKASHHGSEDSFYPELWDDLFGQNSSIVLVSADGSVRPTRAFLESFQPRRNKGIDDQVYCTGPIDPQRHPEFLALGYQAVLDFASRRVRDSKRVPWGNIEITMPFKGSITVRQPYLTPV